MEDLQASEEVTSGWAVGGWWPRNRRDAAPPGKTQLLLPTATWAEVERGGGSQRATPSLARVGGARGRGGAHGGG